MSPARRSPPAPGAAARPWASDRRRARTCSSTRVWRPSRGRRSPAQCTCGDGRTRRAGAGAGGRASAGWLRVVNDSDRPPGGHHDDALGSRERRVRAGRRQPGQAEPAAGPAGEAPFDPYRYGRPDHPIPAEYAPPGYTGPIARRRCPIPTPAARPRSRRPAGFHARQPVRQPARDAVQPGPAAYPAGRRRPYGPAPAQQPYGSPAIRMPAVRIASALRMPPPYGYGPPPPQYSG